MVILFRFDADVAFAGEGVTTRKVVAIVGSALILLPLRDLGSGVEGVRRSSPLLSSSLLLVVVDMDTTAAEGSTPTRLLLGKD